MVLDPDVRIVVDLVVLGADVSVGELIGFNIFGLTVPV